MKIISILARIVRWMRAPDSHTIPAWKNQLDAMSHRQLSDLVIPPEEQTNSTTQQCNAANN